MPHKARAQLYEPTWHVSDVADIDWNEMNREGIYFLILDLDGCMAEAMGWWINHRAFIALREAKGLGQLRGICFVSNVIVKTPDLYARLKWMAKLLEAEFVPGYLHNRKPSKKIFAHALAKMPGATPATAVVAGDQRGTDIYGANLSGIRSILVEPYGKNNLWRRFTVWVHDVAERWVHLRIIIFRHKAIAWIERAKGAWPGFE